MCKTPRKIRDSSVHMLQLIHVDCIAAHPHMRREILHLSFLDCSGKAAHPHKRRGILHLSFLDCSGTAAHPYRRRESTTRISRLIHARGETTPLLHDIRLIRARGEQPQWGVKRRESGCGSSAHAGNNRQYTAAHPHRRGTTTMFDLPERVYCGSSAHAGNNHTMLLR
jgi:hypothetical protein